MAGWKLTALLAATVGAGGLAGVGIFAFLPHSAPAAAPAAPPWTEIQVVQVGPAGPGPAVIALVYAAMAAGGLVLLAARRLAARRLARRGTAGRDRLSPAVTASSFLLVSALVFALTVSGVAVLIDPVTPVVPGPVSAASLVPGAVATAGYLAVAAGFGLQAALRRARTGPGSGARARPRSGSG